MNNSSTPYRRVSAKIKNLVKDFTESAKAKLCSIEKKLAAVSQESARTHKRSIEAERSLKGSVREMKKELHEHFGKVEGNAKTLRAEISAKFKTFASDFDRNRNIAAQTHRELSQNMDRISELLDNLREFSAKKEEDVRRLRKGYDWCILENFVIGITHVLHEMQEKINALEEAGDAHAETLKYFRDYLLDELASHGVKRFGDEFVGQKKPAACAEAEFSPINTNDPALNETVSRVLSYGFRYNGGDGNGKIVKTAILEFYRFSPAPTTNVPPASEETHFEK